MRAYCLKKIECDEESYLMYNEDRYTIYLPHAGFYETLTEVNDALLYEKQKDDFYYESSPDKTDGHPEYEIVEVEINIVNKEEKK